MAEDRERNFERRLLNLETKYSREWSVGNLDFQLWSILFTVGFLVLTFIFSGELNQYIKHFTMPRVSLAESSENPLQTLVLERYEPYLFQDMEIPEDIVVQIRLSDKLSKKMISETDSSFKLDRQVRSNLISIFESICNNSNKVEKKTSALLRKICSTVEDRRPDSIDSKYSDHSKYITDYVKVYYSEKDDSGNRTDCRECSVTLQSVNRASVYIPSFRCGINGNPAIAKKILIDIHKENREDFSIASIGKGVDLGSLKYPAIDWFSSNPERAAKIISFFYIVVLCIFVYMITYNIKTLIAYLSEFFRYRDFVRKWKTIILYDEFFSAKKNKIYPEEENLKRAYSEYNEYLVSNGAIVVSRNEKDRVYTIEMSPGKYPFWRLVFKFLRPVTFQIVFHNGTNECVKIDAGDLEKNTLKKYFESKYRFFGLPGLLLLILLFIVIGFSLAAYVAAICTSWTTIIANVIVVVVSFGFGIRDLINKRMERLSLDKKKKDNLAF